MTGNPLLKEIEDIKAQRNQYLNNAVKCSNQGESRKAGEMIWGAITQSLKALALSRSLSLDRHRQFYEFAQQISKATENRYFLDELRYLEYGHVNFYHEILNQSDFPEYFDRAVKFIHKLDDLLVQSLT